jgi:hypothetical protein
MSHVYWHHKIYLDIKTYLSTSILQRIINVSLLKTQRGMRIMMVIEEGSARTWLR